MKISTRVHVGLGAVFLLTVGVIGVGWNALSDFREGVDQASSTTRLDVDFTAVRQHQADFVASHNPDDADAAMALLVHASGMAAELQAGADDPEIATEYADIGESASLYEDSLTTFVAAAGDADAQIDRLAQVSIRVVAEATAINAALEAQITDLSAGIAADEAALLTHANMASRAEHLQVQTLRVLNSLVQFRQSGRSRARRNANDAIDRLEATTAELQEMVIDERDRMSVNSLASVVGVYRRIFETIVGARETYETAQDTIDIQLDLIMENVGLLRTQMEALAVPGRAAGTDRFQFAAGVALSNLLVYLSEDDVAAGEQALADFERLAQVAGTVADNAALAPMVDAVAAIADALPGLLASRAELAGANQIMAATDQQMGVANDTILGTAERTVDVFGGQHQILSSELVIDRTRLSALMDLRAHSAHMVASANQADAARSDYVLDRMPGHVARVNSALENLLSSIESVGGVLDDEEMVSRLASMAEAVTSYRNGFDRLIDLLSAQEEANASMQALAQEVGNSTALIAEQQLANMHAIEEESIMLLLAGAAVAVVITIVLGSATRSTIVRPITGMTTAMSRLAAGEKSVAVPALKRRDEIGQMAKAVQVFKENAEKIDAMQAEKLRAEAERQEERRRDMARLATEFEDSVGCVVDGLVSATTQLRGTADDLAQTAEDASNQTQSVSVAVNSASQSVDTVAAASTELGSSIQEISRQVHEQSEKARLATEATETSRVRVQGLSEKAETIGEVISLITSIAEQTNLLALNATIEAARAGDAGRGFAVVASEVKNLASQTAQATEQIAAQISAVQTETKTTVDAIESVVSEIAVVAQIANAIAAAVEQQSAATQEIGCSVTEAANSTRDVSSNVSAVTDAAARTGVVAQDLLGASGQLSTQAGSLKDLVHAFLSKVRTAA